MPKRAADASSSDLDHSSDSDVKPRDLDDHESSSDSSPTKKAKKSQTKSKKDKADKGGGRVRNNWTAEEDRIFFEIMERSCTGTIWQEVKNDGRLAHRGASGIKVHCASVFNKLKKQSGGE